MLWSVVERRVGSMLVAAALLLMAAGSAQALTNCDAPIGALAHGASAAVSDSTTAPTLTSGSATATCNNGTLVYSGTSCTPGCASQTVNWGAGCSATIAASLHTNSGTLTNTASGYTGTVTATCTNGTLSQSGASCTSTGGGCTWLSASPGSSPSNPTLAADDWYGVSVAIEGALMVVGATHDNAGASNSGTAYVHNSSTGALVATLSNPTPAVDDLFGNSVDISGTTVAVGAHSDNTGASNAGAAYIFNANTGALLRTINNPSPAADDNFGYRVAIDGNLVAVSCHRDDTGASSAGIAYVFNVSTGALVSTINNPAPTSSDSFSFGLDLQGNTLVATAMGDNANTGAAYVFNATTGALVTTIPNPNPLAGDFFGYSVDIDGDLIAVGAYRDMVSGFTAGSTYVFNATSGALITSVHKPNPGNSNTFGAWVELSGNTLIVGSPGDNTGAALAGSAYIFNATTGALISTINNPAPADDWFGSVAIDGTRAAIGAYRDNLGAADAGAVYSYTGTCAP